jgi:hypothetical protein
VSDIAVENLLYDHDLDAHPAAVGPSVVSAKSALKGIKDGAIVGRGGFAETAAWRLFSELLARSILFFLSNFLLLIPIAVFAPGALRSQFLVRRAGTVLFFQSAFFLVFVLVAVSEFHPIVAAWPYLGVACLLGGCGLAAYYLNLTKTRFWTLRARSKEQGASRFSVLMAALGFQDGTIPPSLRLFVVYGLMGGVFATVTHAMTITEMMAAGPGEANRRVVLLGDGRVRGEITSIAGGPFQFGTEGDAVGSYCSGGNVGPGRRFKGWVHIKEQGRVSGEGLTVEMTGRGILFQGRPAIQSWLLVNVAYLLSSVLLVVASATAAKGMRVGFLLYVTWAILVLGHEVILMAWLPGNGGFERWIFCRFYAAAALAVFLQTSVRLYLGRTEGVTSQPSDPRHSLLRKDCLIFAN